RSGIDSACQRETTTLPVLSAVAHKFPFSLSEGLIQFQSIRFPLAGIGLSKTSTIILLTSSPLFPLAHHGRFQKTTRLWNGSRPHDKPASGLCKMSRSDV